VTLRSLWLAYGYSASCLLLFVATAGCGRLAEESATGGASSSGGAGMVLGSGGQGEATGGANGTGSGGTVGVGGGLDIDVEVPADLPLEEYLEKYAWDGPFTADRPPAPEDHPALLPLGEPGWRDSTEYLCSELTGRTNGELWADDEGVALLTASCPFILDGHGSGCLSGSELWFNDGSGWAWIWGLARPEAGLAGVAGGPLLVDVRGGLAVGRDGQVQSELASSANYAFDFFGDGLGPAYALLPGEERGQLYRYDGDDWTELGTFSQTTWSFPSSLAVIDDEAYFVDSARVARAALGSDFEVMPGVPSGGTYIGLTGTAPDRLWLADYYGTVLHYDGANWLELGAFEGEFRDFLTVDDQVFLLTSTQFSRVNDSGVFVIHELEVGTFYSIAGVDPREVFLSARDYELEDYECGGLQTFVYDGEEFHRF
jgi:hypothetical protein